MRGRARAISLTTAREEREARKLSLALMVCEMVFDIVDQPPDRNCSCHLNPPCSDCVEYGYTREMFDAAREALRLEEFDRGRR